MRVRHPCQSRIFRQHLTCEDWCPVPFRSKQKEMQKSRESSIVVKDRSLGEWRVDILARRQDAAHMLPMWIKASIAAFSSGVCVAVLISPKVAAAGTDEEWND